MGLKQFYESMNRKDRITYRKNLVMNKLSFGLGSFDHIASTSLVAAVHPIDEAIDLIQALAFLDFFCKDLFNHIWRGSSLAEFHHLTDQEVKCLIFSSFYIRDGLLIFLDYLIN